MIKKNRNQIKNTENKIIDKVTKKLSIKSADISPDKNKVNIINELTMDASIQANGSMGFDSASFNPNYLGDLSIQDSLIYENHYINPQTLSFYQQNSLINSVNMTLAQECFKKGFKFVSTSEDDKSDKILALEQRANQLKMKETLQHAMHATFSQGGSFIYPKLVNDDLELQNELFIDSSKLSKGCLQYFQVIEPFYCSALNFNSYNPLAQDFYEPTLYTVMSQQVHASRLIKFIYIPAPKILKPMYRFFGISLTQMLVPYVKNFENIRNNIADIVNRLNLSVLSTDLNDIIFECATSQSLSNRLYLFNQCRDNKGVLAIDAEREKFEQVSMNLTGLPELQVQALKLICLISKIPSSKVFNENTGGLGSNGESDIRNFYDTIIEIQQNAVKNNAIRMMHLMMYDIFGEVDPDITIEFNSLWEINKLEDSQIQLNQAQKNNMYIQAGVIDAQEIREQLIKDPTSGYEGLDIDREIESIEQVEDIENEETYIPEASDRPDRA